MHDRLCNVLLQYRGIYEKANIEKLKAMVYVLERGKQGPVSRPLLQEETH